MPTLVAVVAKASKRPRYAFMLLNLIAEAARPDGSAGPLVVQGRALVSLRDWLCDALSPMGDRDPRRLALAAKVRDELERSGQLPDQPGLGERVIEEEVRARVRRAGKTNLSRAVSELVDAGLLRRHYQGYRVDHQNRGAGRQAVYTLAPPVRRLLMQPVPRAAAHARFSRQGELFG
ncbi:hypothetical protein PX554_20165 [Sphingomonas sp. H39-1-10]|uniref:hypothetical protein n=1 Tax=Sphingomonas pollutisoli TaxID=3030829 RepID=UPI0023B8F556|nr:hypothetical protein [Sphingomonas pollutisoli]MDF0490449.1 hypothetical protein [Sphingomonas pollutisoli]